MMTSRIEMIEDLALVMLSNDLSKKHGTTITLDSWPTPDEMAGAAFVAEQVRIEWAENIQHMYRSDAKMIAIRLRKLGYGHKEP